MLGEFIFWSVLAISIFKYFHKISLSGKNQLLRFFIYLFFNLFGYFKVETPY
jgi:hypothetical protein